MPASNESKAVERCEHRFFTVKILYVGFSIALTSIIALLLLISDEPLSTGLTPWLSDLVVESIASGGYSAIALLMVLDGACVPIPSEVILAFSGFLVEAGRLDFWKSIASGAMGSILGSLLAYFAGLKLGREFVERYGRYVMLGEDTLKTAEQWFKRYGEVAVLVSRFIPLVRTAISVPAGVGKMPLKNFVLLTALGSVLWNCIITYFGIMLGKNWLLVETMMNKLDIPILLAMVLTIGYMLLYSKNKGSNPASRNRDLLKGLEVLRRRF